jgi:hypothetical protein
MELRAEHLPGPMLDLVDAAVAEVARDNRIVGLTIGGSAALDRLDSFSDLDLLVVCADGAETAMLADGYALATRLGPLLSAFTGEHVGEPRLWIALYGPPLVHVDLKFIAERDLASRVEDGLIAWERDGRVSAALRGTQAAWPAPDPQWIEDRFWVWIHYGAAKLARGELFECLDLLAHLRSTVFGPLLAMAQGERPQGVRRLESYAGERLAALERTIGDHTFAGCVSALHAAVELYRCLRGQLGATLEERSEAERAVLAYLDHVTA